MQIHQLLIGADPPYVIFFTGPDFFSVFSFLLLVRCFHIMLPIRLLSDKQFCLSRYRSRSSSWYSIFKLTETRINRCSVPTSQSSDCLHSKDQWVNVVKGENPNMF